MIGSNNTFTLYRLQEVSNQHTYGSALYSDIDCYIESKDPTLSAVLDEQNAFETYLMIVEDLLDINRDDKIVDSNSNTYIVTGVMNFTNNSDVVNQLEVTMVKKYE